MVDAPIQLPLFEEALRDYNASSARQSERPTKFMTTSSEPVNRLYTPEDFHEQEYLARLGFPGQWPYTRSVLISFPSAEEFDRWYGSPEYQALAKHRFKASTGSVAMLNGFS